MECKNQPAAMKSLPLIGQSGKALIGLLQPKSN